MRSVNTVVLPEYSAQLVLDSVRRAREQLQSKDNLSLPIRIREDLSFDECLVTQLIFGHKNIFFTVLYRNPINKANSAEFQKFTDDFENLYKEYRLGTIGYGTLREDLES